MTATALTLAAFTALYAQCAPPGSPPVAELAGIAVQESALRPYAIRDEATGESLFPPTYADAVRIATERDAAGHTLGLGLFQITHRRNWLRHGLTIANAFDPCTNLRAGIAHYAENIRDAARQLYNSGRINGAPGYAASVNQHVARVSVALSAGTVAPSSPSLSSIPTPAPTPTTALGRGTTGREFAYATTTTTR